MGAVLADVIDCLGQVLFERTLALWGWQCCRLTGLQVEVKWIAVKHCVGCSVWPYLCNAGTGQCLLDMPTGAQHKCAESFFCCASARTTTSDKTQAAVGKRAGGDVGWCGTCRPCVGARGLRTSSATLLWHIVFSSCQHSQSRVQVAVSGFANHSKLQKQAMNVSV